MKPVKSTDPRKPAIVAALKAKSGCSKITNVRESPNSKISHLFYGDALKFQGQKYENIGTFEVSVEA